MLPAGYLADRYMRTRIIAVVLASWGAVSALNAAVRSYWQFLAVRAALGVGETVDNPASQSLARRLLPAGGAGPGLRAASGWHPIVGAAIGTVLGRRHRRAARVALGLPHGRRAGIAPRAGDVAPARADPWRERLRRDLRGPRRPPGAGDPAVHHALRPPPRAHRRPAGGRAAGGGGADPAIGDDRHRHRGGGAAGARLLGHGVLRAPQHARRRPGGRHRRRHHPGGRPRRHTRRRPARRPAARPRRGRADAGRGRVAARRRGDPHAHVPAGAALGAAARPGGRGRAASSGAWCRSP